MRKQFGILSSKDGFSSIDTILAVMILAVGIFGGALAIQGSVVSSVNSDHNVVATQLAQEKVEQVLADSEFHGSTYVNDSSNYPEEQIGSYTRVVTISEVSADDLSSPDIGSGLNKVDIEVSWGNQDYQQIRLSTIVAEIDE